MNDIICAMAESEKGLKTIPSESADVIICDPPYNEGKDFGTSKDRMPIKEYVVWVRKWMDQCERILKQTGMLFFWGRSEILRYVSTDFPYPLNENQRWMPWVYGNKSTASTGSFWLRSHETVIACWKSEDMIFDFDEARGVYTLQFARMKLRARPKGDSRMGNKDSDYKRNPKGANPRDFICADELYVHKLNKKGELQKVMDIPRGVDKDVLSSLLESQKDVDFITEPALSGTVGEVERWNYCKECETVFHSLDKKQKEIHKSQSGQEQESDQEQKTHTVMKHPTQKPYWVTRKLLAPVRVPGGTVVIPFCGTGSECAVAEDLGMNYIAFDENPDFVKMAKETLRLRKKGTMQHEAVC